MRKRCRRDQELQELVGYDAESTCVSFDLVILSEEIDYDYVDHFYDNVFSIYYKYSITKLNEILSLHKADGINSKNNYWEKKSKVDELVTPNK